MARVVMAASWRPRAQGAAAVHTQSSENENEDSQRVGLVPVGVQRQEEANAQLRDHQEE